MSRKTAKRQSFYVLQAKVRAYRRNSMANFGLMAQYNGTFRHWKGGVRWMPTYPGWVKAPLCWTTA